MTPLQQVGGRKFIAAMSSLVALTSLVAFGRISDVVFGYALAATVAAYITGNVAQKAVTKAAQ